jgi:hypothetical protein
MASLMMDQLFIALGRDFLPWRADNGDILLVKCYFSPQVIETIISPTDVVLNEQQYLLMPGVNILTLIQGLVT